MASESLVKTWLEVALAEENLKNFTVKIVGNAENGEGFLGDVVFVKVTGTNQQDEIKEYDLVLKCNKTSASLFRKNPAMKSMFRCESYMYETVFPEFRKFQTDRGINDPFDCLAKCYGVFRNKSRIIIVLENLKKLGYDLWPMRYPQTKKHIGLVLTEYARFHAVSIAMKEQNPELFKRLVDGIIPDIFRQFMKSTDFIALNEKTIKEVYDLFQNDLSQDTLEKWLNFKDQLAYVCYEMDPPEDDLQAVIHGDCWNNNFMFKYEGTESSGVSKLAILDWQISKVFSPVFDLSYYLFSCISGEDVADLDTMLKKYYFNLCHHLARLGTTMRNHSLEKFFEEWRKYARYGLMIALLPIKASFMDKEDLPDVAKNVESGDDLSKGFDFEIKNVTGYKKRMKPIVQYAVENGLI